MKKFVIDSMDGWGGKPLPPCRLCGGTTVPEPRAFPDATQRVCWLGSNGMSWCGAGKVGKVHVFVGQPELPGIDEKPYDGELQRVTVTPVTLAGKKVGVTVQLPPRKRSTSGKHVDHKRRTRRR